MYKSYGFQIFHVHYVYASYIFDDWHDNKLGTEL